HYSRIQAPEDPQGISHGITRWRKITEVLGPTHSWAHCALVRPVKVREPERMGIAGRQPLRLYLRPHAVLRPNTETGAPQELGSHRNDIGLVASSVGLRRGERVHHSQAQEQC